MHEGKSLITDALGEKAQDSSRVVLVTGSTGSGKSLMIGRLITELTLMTVPKKAAAQRLAQQMACERGEAPGLSIGFQFKNRQAKSQHTQILITTEGTALRLLDSLAASLRYLVIDEVHEQTANTELLLALAKYQLLPRHPRLRLVLISSTSNVEDLHRYFQRHLPVRVKLPSLKHTIHTEYLEDSNGYVLFDELSPGAGGPGMEDSEVESICVQASKYFLRGDGDILIFLPGKKEITLVQRRVKEKDRLVVLHGTSAQRDMKEFGTVRGDWEVPRIILATNIAESSITFPNLKYVIDSGYVKRSYQEYGAEKLTMERISQAEAVQRQGRAGRTQSGTCFRNYTKEEFLGFRKYPESSVARTRIDSLVLMEKAYSLESPKYLSQIPHRRVQEAAAYLRGIGAFRCFSGLSHKGRYLFRCGVGTDLGHFLWTSRTASHLLALLSVSLISAYRECLTHLSEDSYLKKPINCQNLKELISGKFLAEALGLKTLPEPCTSSCEASTSADFSIYVHVLLESIRHSASLPWCRANNLDQGLLLEAASTLRSLGASHAVKSAGCFCSLNQDLTAAFPAHTAVQVPGTCSYTVPNNAHFLKPLLAHDSSSLGYLFVFDSTTLVHVWNR
ncbi:ATP-dependent helicase HrpA [Nematocida displodere]|uniref:ATP-dependent helicase HrpA n=1 Tax=Nematocida displodere TaxID=1805483 RepID=A0A177EES8_9MICR|nr:ATP-dependent helicase HrpA [Nematocida displodere]